MANQTSYDVCIIGSGAGGAPIAWRLAQAGFRVVVLEKGPWFRTHHFRKDELACCRRPTYTPPPWKEPRVVEYPSRSGWKTYRADFWNATLVGGATNIMSGYFHRMKPSDFRLLSTYGLIEGANVVDWPITYDDLEPYYTAVEHLVGISGKVVPHRWQEPRSTPDFPFPPLKTNVVASWLDEAATQMGVEIIPAPRAILSRPKDQRKACYYSNYCGSYGCASDAKGSARVAFLEPAVAQYGLEIRPFAHVYQLECDGRRIRYAWYIDHEGQRHRVAARLFVVAAQPVETIRLLLLSKCPHFPHGIGNNYGQVGQNVIFSAGGIVYADLYYKDFGPTEAARMKERGWFINRAVQHWYELEDPDTGRPIKGGMLEFMFEHDNPIRKAVRQKWQNGKLLYGSALKQRLKEYFTQRRGIQCEIFVDWLPNPNTFITLDPKIKDFRGFPVARIRAGYHPHDLKVGRILAQHAKRILEAIGARNIRISVSGNPPPNLIAGGCRMGTDPRTSVTDPSGRVHEVENLFIADASTFPTGGSVQYTWTIYANSLRIADILLRDFL